MINAEYKTDRGGFRKILISAVDTGHLNFYPYQFIDRLGGRVVGVKGRSDATKMVKATADIRMWTPAKERAHLFILETDLLKDEYSERVGLQWTKGNAQPYGYLNFPISDQGKYTDDYFSQMSSEHKILHKDDDGNVVGWKWSKIKSTSQNHFLDCHVYNMALKDIIATRICREAEIKYPSWTEFSELMKKVLKKVDG